MKTCTNCGAIKEISAFSKRARAKDGMQSQCKVCCAAYNVQWQVANKKKLKAYQAAYYAANQRKLLTRSNRRRKTHREEILAYDTARRKANPGRCRESKAAWEKRNPLAIAVKGAKRRAALKRGQPPWVKKYTTEMKEFYAACRRAGLTADHIVPLQGETVSGLHVPWNMQMLTLRENSTKRNRLLEE